MQTDQIAEALVGGTILEGAHYGEPVQMQTTFARGEQKGATVPHLRLALLNPEMNPPFVTDCKTSPKLHMIQDPASKLRVREEVKIVRYMVARDDWSNASECQR